MSRIVLESPVGSLDLHNMTDDKGRAVLRGLTGLGLPPVAGQWFEGAGDGASWRGERVLARPIDLPLLISDDSGVAVADVLNLLSRILAAGPVLHFTDARGDVWGCPVRRTGGGDPVWGEETAGKGWWRSVITLQAGDPFWTRERPESLEFTGDSSGAGLLPYLSELKLSSSQAYGTQQVTNPGSATAYLVWTITGPGSGFVATGPNGEVFTWTGTLAAGESLTIDTKAGTVVDGTGANRYDLVGAAPRFWVLPPGDSTISVTMAGASATSRIQAFWQPRSWLVF